MRTKLLLKTFFISLVVIICQDISIAQENPGSCKVLLESISGEYTGECKDGLANGEGIASGIDVYEGKFKKGLPHGIGKYTWEDNCYYYGNWKGGKKSGIGSLYEDHTQKITKGLWKNDVFFNEIVEPPYELILKERVKGVYFFEDNTKTPHQIEFVFNSAKGPIRSVPGLKIYSNNGQTEVDRMFSGIKNVTFPLECTVEFVVKEMRRVVKFKINKASSWKITIR
ncbi:MAG: hypothetical protein GQ564_17590 [Bacteroidales bacterium]|nr:hypothetical protein [Bacteroidales bacterium]